MPCRSSPRKRGGGFTFEVQHFGEGFSRGPEVKALAWGGVVGADERVEASNRERSEVGLARQEAAHAADGVLDTALLPRRVGITEVGFDGEPMQRLVAGELGAVVEGYCSAELLRHWGKQSGQTKGDTGVGGRRRGGGPR